MKKILVTGGAGFIGTNLIKRLLKEGHEVVSLDDYETGTEDNHTVGASYVIGDINSLNFWKGEDFDLVYHLAALSRIQPSFKNPMECFRVNTEGSQVVAEWARLNDVKVVYAGSSSRWHDPFQSPYACYKHMGEEIFKLYRQTYGINAEICRFYNVYGPNEIIEGDWAALIGIWRRQVRDGEKITIIGNGEQRRDFTHVVDIVDALYKVGMGNQKHKDAWELGSGTNYSINEVFRMFFEKYPQIESVYLPDQKGNYKKTLRKNDDALERLHWKPKDRLREYIQSLS
jgi:UDP-glucose 4-epimerase